MTHDPLRIAAPTILVVEDDAAIADVLAIALERDGFACRRAAFAADARRLLAADPPDLVVLDIGLPDGSGLDLCRSIARDAGPPVIFLSARADEIDRVVGLEIGADDYVVKPFSPRELIARVRAVLRRRAAAAATAAAAPATSAEARAARAATRPPPPPRRLVHDPQRRAIAFDGRPLPLSRAEYLLLAALLDAGGRVLSRGQLLDAAGLAAATSDRAIDTHVKSLRAKLRDAGADAGALRTQRGFGYRFEERDDGAADRGAP